MKLKKIIFITPLLLVFLLSGCSSSAPSAKTVKKLAEASKKDNDKGITALEALKKVQKEVNKWDKQAKLVDIRDKSYASFQRQDGLADVWEFVFDQCRGKNEMLKYCNKGKSRTYIYSTTKGGWGPKGVSAGAEEPSSYSVPIDTEKLIIDTDKAVDLARKKMGQKRNPDEEFIISTYTTDDGTPYWDIVRQCYGYHSQCSSSDGYGVYVNASTGEVLNSKPKN